MNPLSQPGMEGFREDRFPNGQQKPKIRQRIRQFVPGYRGIAETCMAEYLMCIGGVTCRLCRITGERRQNADAKWRGRYAVHIKVLSLFWIFLQPCDGKGFVKARRLATLPWRCC